MKKFLTLILALVLGLTCLLGMTACKKDSVKLEVLSFDLTDESYAFAVKEGNTTLKIRLIHILTKLKTTVFSKIFWINI